MSGAWILYGASYGVQSFVYAHLPLFAKPLVDRLCHEISQSAMVTITIGCIVPFGRGYICIAAGLVHVNPGLFACITIVTDTIWNLFWISIGVVTGKLWETAIEKYGKFAKQVGALLVGLVIGYC